jgi:hypothetical protein
MTNNKDCASASLIQNASFSFSNATRWRQKASHGTARQRARTSIRYSPNGCSQPTRPAPKWAGPIPSRPKSHNHCAEVLAVNAGRRARRTRNGALAGPYARGNAKVGLTTHGSGASRLTTRGSIHAARASTISHSGTFALWNLCSRAIQPCVRFEKFLNPGRKFSPVAR